MLNQQYQNAIFDGVELSNMDIDQLRSKESELTGFIVRHNNDLLSHDERLSVAKCMYCQGIIRAIADKSQSLDILKSEIEARYSQMTV